MFNSNFLVDLDSVLFILIFKRQMQIFVQKSNIFFSPFAPADTLTFWQSFLRWFN